MEFFFFFNLGIWEAQREQASELHIHWFMSQCLQQLWPGQAKAGSQQLNPDSDQIATAISCYFPGSWNQDLEVECKPRHSDKGRRHPNQCLNHYSKHPHLVQNNLEIHVQCCYNTYFPCTVWRFLMPGRTAGTWNVYFLRNCQTVFQNGCTLHSHWQWGSQFLLPTLDYSHPRKLGDFYNKINKCKVKGVPHELLSDSGHPPGRHMLESTAGRTQGWHCPTPTAWGAPSASPGQ